MSKHLPAYGPLPSLRGDCAGCPDTCCGPAICSTVELETIRAYVAEHGTQPQRQGIDCPLYLSGRCAAYEVRPAVCRLYGHVDGLACSQGYDVRASRSQRRPYELAIAKARREGVRFVHELVYSQEETAAIALDYHLRRQGALV